MHSYKCKESSLRARFGLDLLGGYSTGGQGKYILINRSWGQPYGLMPMEEDSKSMSFCCCYLRVCVCAPVTKKPQEYCREEVYKHITPKYRRLLNRGPLKGSKWHRKLSGFSVCLKQDTDL